MSEGQVRKQAYFSKVNQLLQDYSKIMIVEADHVGSNQMHQIRASLRGKAIILMGKNTMIRKAVKARVGSDPRLDGFIPHIKGNVGFIFCKGDLQEIRNKIHENKVAAPAKAGSFAPIDVFVPAGNTGMEPTMTSFFQALNIATKIVRGAIEIIADVHLVKKGEKVGNSEATLLAKLNIRPFSYGLRLINVYDNGSVYAPAVLDLTDNDILARFKQGVQNIAAVGLQIGYPTIATVPHSLINGYKNLLAVAFETQYSFKRAEAIKAFIANPTAAAAQTAPAHPAKTETKDVKKKEEKKKEEVKEEPEDEDIGIGGLF
jgi:large subunit ribosomal protein LP0